MSNDQISISHTHDTTAEELRNFDWYTSSNIASSHTDSKPSNHTPSNHALKQEYQENMLARYPDFEVQTATDITELKHEVRRLSDMNKVMVWLVLGVMFMQVITKLN